jgi:hypothetical protein
VRYGLYMRHVRYLQSAMYLGYMRAFGARKVFVRFAAFV